MTRRSGLGRGLDALIPAGEATDLGGVNQIPIDRILPNPRQPRGRFDTQETAELAASISEHGVIQPLIVTSGDKPGQYVLIAGERRLVAARQAGLDRVPAIVREASDQQRLELALIENVQRADLSPLETAEAYRQLAEDFNLSHEQIAKRVAKSRVTVTNTLRLLKLSPASRQALADGLITEGHGRALLALEEQNQQETALQILIDLELNVRQAEALFGVVSRTPEFLGLTPTILKSLAEGSILEGHGRVFLGMSAEKQEALLQTILAQKLDVQSTIELVERIGKKSAKAVLPSNPQPEVVDMERRLSEAIGQKVKLTQRGKGWSVTITFSSDEELNALFDRLLDAG